MKNPKTNIPARTHKSQESKNPSPEKPRARKGKRAGESEKKLMALTRAESAARRVIKGAARLVDRITDKDREAAVGAIRAALNAQNTIFDALNKKLIQIPDHKTQLAAATLLLAYDEGLPVRRIEALVQNARTPEERIAVLRGSPEMLKAMRAVSGIAVLEMDGEVVDAEFEAVQETGGENDGAA